MTEEILIPGLLRIPIDVGTKERPRKEFFYLINLFELTNAVVQGTPSLGPSDTSGNADFWTDEQIAQLVMNLSPSALAEMSDDEKERLTANTLDIIAGSPKPNRLAWKYARQAGSSERPGGWHSTLVNPEGAQELGPTFLWIPESKVRNGRLKMRYRDLVSHRTYKAMYEDAHYLTRIRDFVTDNLDPLKTRQAELDAHLGVVRHVSSRVSNAHLAVVAMHHCADSQDERRKHWTHRQPIEAGDDLFGKQLVPRLPTATERENAAKVRDSYLPNLFKNLGDLLAWMSSGASHKGARFADATIRNQLAQKLLDNLRTNEDILTVLENHLYVDTILWRRVESVLLQCFHSLLLAPNTREQLLRGELSALARHVTAHEPAIDLLSEKTKRAREIKEAMARFVPEIELRGETNRLSQAFLELKSHADPLFDHRSTITQLWALTLPSVMDHVERLAREAGDPNPSAVAAGWSWRSAFGVIELDADTQKEVFERAVKFTENPTIAEAHSIFASQGLQVENRFWNSKASWSAYETAVAIIAATDAVMAHAEDPSVDTAIEAWTSAYEAVKAIPDLAGALKETHMFIRMASGPAKSLISKVADLADAVPVKYLDGVVALLKFEATARATRAVVESKTASGNDKDIAREEALIGYVSMLLSVAGIVAGSPFVLAGSVLTLGSAILLNRDVWNACLSSIEGLPGPGRAVKLVWKEALDGVGGGQSLSALVDGTPWKARIEIDLELLRDVTSDASQVGTGAFWPLSSGDFAMSPRMAGMLHRQYGLNLEFAKELVAY